MYSFYLTVRNTHFVIKVSNNPKARSVVDKFNSNLITYKSIFNPWTKKFKRVEDRRYYYKVNNNTYHYSIQLLNGFIKRALKVGIRKEDFKITYDKNYKPGELYPDIRDHLEDRDYQTLFINKALNTNPLVLVDLKTGKGKTYVAARVITTLKVRAGVVVLPRYIEKWKNDIKDLTTATDEDIFVVEGKDSLSKLLKSDKTYEFVIFSLPTLDSYIKRYDKGDSVEPPPEDLFKLLGLGIMLIDEVHQSFHQGYMVTIRLNPLKLISLSATLDNLDANIVMMYETLYPKDVRCGDLVKFKPYAIIIACNFFIGNPKKVRTEGPMGYSHTLFEYSMIRNSVLRKQYIEMVLYYVKKGYLERKRKGDKLLILVQTIDMANLLVGYFKSKIKDCKIGRYVEEDPYSVIMKSDITVSTNGSAGAALDIPNLITTIQLVSAGSLQLNVQAFGRLREIKEIDVKYYYLYSSSLSKQYKLHETRKGVLRKLAKQFLFEEYPKRITC